MDEGIQPFVNRVTGPAGTAVIFTEALTHGALPWTGAGERRTVFFKYSPHPVSWAAGYFDASQYDGLSQRHAKFSRHPTPGTAVGRSREDAHPAPLSQCTRRLSMEMP
jgi:hypothetical protein